MIIVLSPSKTLDATVDVPSDYTLPGFMDDTMRLVDVLKALSLKDIARLMTLSDALARLNRQRYQDFTVPFMPHVARPAILAFKGDVYTGLNAKHFSQADRVYADAHLRILSGLYGLLRPHDLIMPYRLEMGTRLHTAHGKNLYEFWGNKITDTLNTLLAQQKQPVLINLASVEYAKAISFKAIDGSIITPVFKEKKGKTTRVVMVHAKRARGMMAGYILRQRLEAPEGIQNFCEAGYGFEPGLSTDDSWVFVR